MDSLEKDALAIDIETLGTDPWNGRPLCVAWASDLASGVTPYEETEDWVWEVLADDTPTIAHTTFDWRYLKLAGNRVNGPYWDTRKMAHTLDENTDLTLASLVKRHLGKEMDKRLRRMDKKTWFITDDARKLLLEEAWEQVPEQVMEYCRRDVVDTYHLYEKLLKDLRKGMWYDLYVNEELPFTEVLVNMECAGLPIDLEAAEKLKHKLKLKSVGQEAELLKQVGFPMNLGSGDQLADLLFKQRFTQPDRVDHGLDLRKAALTERFAKEYGIPAKQVTDDNRKNLKDLLALKASPKGFVVDKVTPTALVGEWYRKGFGWKETPPTPGGKRPSTSTPDLMVHHADKPFVIDLVEWRKTGKVITTYLETYPEHSHNGRLYGRYNAAGTVTHRLSSSNPNMQNQPRRGELGTLIRSLFKGNLIVGDHSQLESRLFAHFSQDPMLLEVYRNDEDIYLKLARHIFGPDIEKEDPERDISKTLYLGSQYGAYPKKLATVLCLNGFYTTEDTAKGYLDELRSWIPVGFAWKDFIMAEAREKGYVKTIGGRYRRLRGSFDKDAPWKKQSKGERQAVNAIIQGSAADVLRKNMLDTRSTLRGTQYDAVALLAQVHDELIWEHPVPEDDEDPAFLLHILKTTCEAPGYDFTVPLKFDPAYCASWAAKDGKDVELEA